MSNSKLIVPTKRVVEEDWVVMFSKEWTVRDECVKCFPRAREGSGHPLYRYNVMWHNGFSDGTVLPEEVRIRGERMFWDKKTPDASEFRRGEDFPLNQFTMPTRTGCSCRSYSHGEWCPWKEMEFYRMADMHREAALKWHRRTYTLLDNEAWGDMGAVEMRDDQVRDLGGEVCELVRGYDPDIVKILPSSRRYQDVRLDVVDKEPRCVFMPGSYHPWGMESQRERIREFIKRTDRMPVEPMVDWHRRLAPYLELSRAAQQLEVTTIVLGYPSAVELRCVLSKVNLVPITGSPLSYSSEPEWIATLNGVTFLERKRQ